MTVRQPNIVLVLADDLGWGDLGCYGATRIPTPRIDAIAAEGIRFTDAHAASAVCTPSRYSLLTGRYSWRSPLKKGVLMGHGPALIEPDRPTMASVLRDAGYRTAAIGKWHLGLGWRHLDGRVWDAFSGRDPLEYQLGDPLAPHDTADVDSGEDVDYSAPFTGGPTELGFERFFGIAGSLNMPPYAYLDQDRTATVPARRKQRFLPGQRPGFESDDWDEFDVDLRFTEEAVRFIREQPVDDRPFFLYFATSAPHRPQVPPHFMRGTSNAGERGDAVAFVDWMVGRIEDALREVGIWDDTVLMFTSDNGAPLIFADERDPEHRPNGPWRGQKGDVWDGGHREPLVVRWPGHVPAGIESDAPVGLIDLLSSLLGLVGVPVPEGVAPDALDRSSAMRGEPEPDNRPLRVYSSMGGALVVAEGRWKACFTTGSGGGLSWPPGEPTTLPELAGQLYDLQVDPYETNNLWWEQPAVAARLLAAARQVGGDDVELPDPSHG